MVEPLRKLFVVCIGLAAVCTGIVLSARDSGWNPALAAKYLDDRQKDWFAWPRAQSADGPCVSCHTGLPYLIARPALRRLLNDGDATIYERGLRDRLASHAGEKPKGGLQGVETIMAAMFVGDADARRKTFDQLWTLQQTDGALKGGWQWYNANLDPWETTPQFRYGAAIAALAIGKAPTDIRATSDAEPRIRALVDFLNDDLPSRPGHVKLAVLWASTTMPSILSAEAKRAIVNEVLKKQQRDGGWSLDALGPWSEHPSAPASLDRAGSNSYATAFTAYVLREARAGSARTDAALAWLRSHQDRTTGAWPAASMNKTYPPGSMEEKFLQDAATGFAAAVLSER
jgi:squalene-hopene/tetraprenyl-beta-curcumene cyclase